MNSRIRLLSIAIVFAILAVHGRRNTRSPLHTNTSRAEPIRALLINRGGR